MYAKDKTKLSDICTEKECIVFAVRGAGAFQHRIMEMGFVKGKMVHVIKNAPLQDPIEYEIMGSHVALRRCEAQQIEVIPIENVTEDIKKQLEDNSITLDPILEKVNPEKNRNKTNEKTITVALIGNPNCGKTSFFNQATGRREKVGNYGGVTIDSKIATFKHKDYTIRLVDLPGTYSITEFSQEELYVRQFLTEQSPDIVLNIVDATNLERNLFLTTQVIDMNIPMLMALNMYDELQKSGSKLDIKTMENLLGFPVIPTAAHRGEGTKDVLNQIITIFEAKKDAYQHSYINYGTTIEHAIEVLTKNIPTNIDKKFSSRYVALKLLEKDKHILDLFPQKIQSEIIPVIDNCRNEIEKLSGDEVNTLITNSKFAFINQVIKSTLIKGNQQNRWAYSIDKILTHKWLSFPILFIFLWLMFQTTFTLGEYPQNWIEMGIDWLGGFVGNVLPEGILTDLLVDGIIAGVGGVLVFLPNILILFFFIAIMEDTGYMARAAFITDRFMHAIGLQGKSFIPLLTGFGCSVPAVMSTRILESPKNRILTVLLVPFMSCSARLPVYLLLVSAFFTHHQGLILLSIYAVGILLSICTALLLKNTLFREQTDQFVMELPPYRIPTAKNVLLHIWDKASQYLKKMGTLILVASIVVWALSYFPTSQQNDNMITENIVQTEENEQIENEIILVQEERNMENSYMGKLGKFIEPVIRPLGFDWKMGVSILTGVAAKEIVVSSMSILYQVDEDDEEGLKTALQNQTYSAGEKIGMPVFTPIVAYGFMLFVLLYCPCLPTLIAASKEIGKKWALLSVCYSTLLAWIVSFLFYQSFGNNKWQEIILGIVLLITIIIIVKHIYKLFTKKTTCSSCTNCNNDKKCCNNEKEE